ncbi:bifunctional DNA primase/polymerase [Pseudonocardia oroxyli]|uniref:Bifunctional DNA primase/polymerase, N-terminal n=1 Tax=Pseudonocardia oroxyli TaxID=366584 RepID=A0A1G7Z1P4_PSEOR|nr:bifunctional DNA primase/polymerase [Pseudonocardia oroxyli]SDH02633.1 Bifunctional DNA primase/polymerase, N-terminal [Pseudonocardia oroxyli]
MASTELMRAALSHAARGWRVFPLRPNDKRPAIRDWEARATTDVVRIRKAWERGPFGIGIACGPSGLVVLDLDRPKPSAVRPPEWNRPGITDGADVLAALAEHHDVEPPMETYSVRTGSGGEHLYYAAPQDVAIRNSAGRIGWLIDVRAAGGYVVAAGSVVRGRTYQASEARVAPLPVWLTRLLAEENDDAHPDRAGFAPLLDAVGRRSAYTAAALRGELDRVLAAAPGHRNHTLNAAAFALGQLVGGGLLPEGLATAALAEASAAIGLPAAEAHRTIRSGLTAGARCPRRASSEGRP